MSYSLDAKICFDFMLTGMSSPVEIVIPAGFNEAKLTHADGTEYTWTVYHWPDEVMLTIKPGPSHENHRADQRFTTRVRRNSKGFYSAVNLVEVPVDERGSSFERMVAVAAWTEVKA